MKATATFTATLTVVLQDDYVDENDSLETLQEAFLERARLYKFLVDINNGNPPSPLPVILTLVGLKLEPEE